MDLWTEHEFRRVAITTRISPRTLEACKAVLVDGVSGQQAASTHKMFASQLSRALTSLREKRAENLKSAAVRENAEELQEFVAAEVGRALYGRDFQSMIAEPGQTYEGPIVAQTSAFLVQKVGRSGVLHDLGKFESIPQLNIDLQIAYGEKGDRAVVSEVRTMTKDSDLSR